MSIDMMDSSSPLTFDNHQLSKLTNVQLIARKLQLTANSLSPDSKAAGYLRASLSINTQRAYRSDIAHFLAWGGTFPATPETVAHYLAEHAESLSVTTLARRIASLSRAHSAQQFESPTKSEVVRATFDGIRRTHATAQRGATPVIKTDLLAMVNDLQGAKGLRDKALLLVGFAGAFRRSELVSLQISDFEFGEKGLIVNLRRSKTDQVGEGRKIGIPFARGNVCPVQALRDWIEFSGIADGPVFRPISRHGRISPAPLTAHAVAQLIKDRIDAIGLSSNNYSGHSLRAGLITSAAMVGVSVWKIKAQSGHRTDSMLSRYVRDADIFTNNAAGAVL